MSGEYVPGGWQGLVLNEAQRLRDELDRVKASAPVDRVKASAPVDRDPVDWKVVDTRLEQAKKLAHERNPRWVRVRLWWSGTSIEQAWAALHGADQALLMIQDPDTLAARLAEIDASVKANLPTDDDRVAEYSKFVADLSALNLVRVAGPDAHYLVRLAGPQALELVRVAGAQAPEGGFERAIVAARPKLRTIKVATDAASDAAHASLRSFRNLLLIVAGVALVGAVTLAVVHALDSGTLALCQAGSHVCPGVGEIELAGGVGGTIGAVFALARVNAAPLTYDLPLVQALLRIPSGALVGLFGVLLIQSNVLGTFGTQTTLALVAYAAFFGYAQEPLLRAVDQRADRVLGDARTKNDPVRAPDRQ